MSRRGWTLVEVLLSVTLLGAVIVVVGPLFHSAVRGGAFARQAVEADRALSRVLRQLREDVDRAESLTLADAAPGRAGRLEVSGPGGAVRYEQADGRVTRSVAGRDETTTWRAPHARVEWRLRPGPRGPVAVEVRTCIRAAGDAPRLANARVFFLGGMRGRRAAP